MAALELEEYTLTVEKHLIGAAKRALLAAAERVVAHIILDLMPAESHPPVDRGLYRAGWQVQRTPDGAEILNTMPYAPIVEYGAEAANVKISRAMIDALTEWVARKRLAPKKEAKQLAWAIAISMKKRGIFNNGHGLRLLERALERLPEFLDEEFRREVEREFG